MWRICTVVWSYFCWGVVVVLLTPSVGGTSGNGDVSVAERATAGDPDAYLEKFGYLAVPPGGTPGNVQRSPESRRHAIREFQRFNGLSVTGNLDRQTLAKMRQPRCGFPDVIRPEGGSTFGTSTNGRNRNRSRNRNRNRSRPRNRAEELTAQSFYVPGHKWKKTQITWRPIGYSRTSRLSQSQQWWSFKRAFDKWAEQTPLTFSDVSGTADIMIKFVRSDHGDGRGNAFDGRGGTLAHAFFPGTSAISGDTHFDDDEQWTLNTEDGTNLEIVAAHEFGHALGLGHSNVAQALMAPYYQGYDPNFKLHKDDIQAIQHLYGGPGRPRTTPRPRVTSRPRVTLRPRVTRRPTRRPSSGRFCNLKFDAVIKAHDGSTYAFRSHDIYKLTSTGGVSRGFPKRANTVFQSAPINIDAAAYSPWSRKTYMFKGSRLWKYTGFRLDSDYPKDIRATNFPTRPKAALVWRDGRVYLFRGRQFWVFDEYRNSIPQGYPLDTRRYWRGIPNNVEAAVRWNDGYTYFFKGSNYFKFSDYYRRKVGGYPKPKAAPWLGCGSRTPK
ncbi:matrix metalloproteinase-19-like [Liolophura sinensis]|uniref:matrix metalloproteinase-19-like n=1 Tax=Liolophura sinensis TaxID=3198878 RepID=UPI003158F788